MVTRARMSFTMRAKLEIMDKLKNDYGGSMRACSRATGILRASLCAWKKNEMVFATVLCHKC